MTALGDHFASKGNAPHNLAESEILQQAIHYKIERAITFENFLTQCQTNFNIFEKEGGDEMSEAAKVRFLFKKVEHSGLISSINAFKQQVQLI